MLETTRPFVETAIAVCTLIGMLYATWSFVAPRLSKVFAPYLSGLRSLEMLPQACLSMNKVGAMESLLATIHGQVMPDNGVGIRELVLQHKQDLHLLTGTVRLILDQDPRFASFEADGNFSIFAVNISFLRWTNRSVDELMGMGWLNCILLEHRERVRAELQSAVAERRVIDISFKLRSSDGSVFEVKFTATPLPEGRGAIQRWIGFMRRADGRVYEDDVT